MPALNEYDFHRSERILKDLENSLRGHAPMLKLEPAPDSRPGILGIANRPGLLRLGLRLASVAFKADAIVSIDEEGTVHRDGQGGLVTFSIIEESPHPSEPASRIPSPGCIVWIIVPGLMLALMLIGLFTVVDWLIG